jgi:GNAT superfamily N-acetyltransferase
MDLQPALEIRMAVRDDWSVIADFNTRLATETEGKTLVPAVIESGVKTLLSNPHHGRYFVACLGNRIVGQLMHTYEWSDWRDGEIWWLQSVYVQPDHRRQGVFRALFQHLEKLARDNTNVVGIRLYAETRNLNALDTYRSLGLELAGYLVLENIFRNSL